MVDGKNISTMDVKSVYKYLGLKLGFGGYETQDVVDTFQEKIERLGKAQLRPQQKLWGLKTVLILSVLHSLVLSNCWVKTLQHLDQCTRRYIRKWLHIPPDTPLGMFDAAVGDGGLGVQCLEYAICRLRRDRVQRLVQSDDAVVRALVESRQSQQLLRRLTKVRKLGYLDVVDKANEREDGDSRSSAVQMGGGRYRWAIPTGSIN